MARQIACNVVKPGAQMFGVARIDEKRDAVLCRPWLRLGRDSRRLAVPAESRRRWKRGADPDHGRAQLDGGTQEVRRQSQKSD